MSVGKLYASGQPPMVGDLVDLGAGQGPRGTVLVVVGGPHEGAASAHSVNDWKESGAGILVEVAGMGFIFEEDPDDETVLVKRSA